MSRISAAKPAVTCVGCFAWGVLPGRYCRACYTFGQLHDIGQCAACRRLVPIKKGYCRLCWLQASLEAKGQVTVLEPFLRRLTCQQLFFSAMHRQRSKGPGPRIGRAGRRRQRPAPALPPIEPNASPTCWRQLRLPIDARRDYTHFDRREHACLDNPLLIQARQVARTLGESRGWTTSVTSSVDRALVIVLSSHVPGDKIRYSELFPVLRRYGLSVGRTIEVLNHLEVFHDDRVPAFDTWIDRKLTDLAPAIRRDVEDWLRALHEGTTRTRPRSQATVWTRLNQILPLLQRWSTDYEHLREITRDDIIAVKDSLQGAQREHTIGALRSLLRFCKKTGRIFRDPTLRIRVERRPDGVILPLSTKDIGQAITNATNPATRLILIMAAVHAARPKLIRQLKLNDIDLGNRRLVVGSHPRPLDDLTHRALLDWLDYRRARWPATANPHLLVTQQTAMGTGPVGRIWITETLRGQTATLERLRVDRQLEEALTRGPDPLHLAAVFGLDDKTAIRYANAARRLLEAVAEHHDPQGSPRTHGQNPPTGAEPT